MDFIRYKEEEARKKQKQKKLEKKQKQKNHLASHLLMIILMIMKHLEIIIILLLQDLQKILKVKKNEKQLKKKLLGIKLYKILLKDKCLWTRRQIMILTKTQKLHIMMTQTVTLRDLMAVPNFFFLIFLFSFEFFPYSQEYHLCNQ